MSAAAEALRAGELVILPTDTVYGLCALAATAAPTERLYAVKGRDGSQPSALLAATIEMLLESLPELDGRPAAVVHALLPGPYTLVLPNPARRYPWLTGASPQAIGVRVPDLPAAAAEVVAASGCVVATSANLPGGADPRRLADVPHELRDRAAAAIDAGELPGTPSTVLDFTGAEPRVIREGAAASSAALERVAAALSGRPRQYDPRT